MLNNIKVDFIFEKANIHLKNIFCLIFESLIFELTRRVF